MPERGMHLGTDDATPGQRKSDALIAVRAYRQHPAKGRRGMLVVELLEGGAVVYWFDLGLYCDGTAYAELIEDLAIKAPRHLAQTVLLLDSLASQTFAPVSLAELVGEYWRFNWLTGEKFATPEPESDELEELGI